MNEKIEKIDLLSELKIVLADEFVAELKQEEDALVLRFVGGQAFRLTVEEIEG